MKTHRLQQLAQKFVGQGITFGVHDFPKMKVAVSVFYVILHHRRGSEKKSNTLISRKKLLEFFP